MYNDRSIETWDFGGFCFSSYMYGDLFAPKICSFSYDNSNAFHELCTLKITHYSVNKYYDYNTFVEIYR